MKLTGHSTIGAPQSIAGNVRAKAKWPAASKNLPALILSPVARNAVALATSVKGKATGLIRSILMRGQPDAR
ncbi:MAG: hypothetical protein CMN71_10725 [Sphingomonadaceae bacterium]|nr:hypothetical protein [Sphingomonadaceae bacterium]